MLCRLEHMPLHQAPPKPCPLEEESVNIRLTEASERLAAEVRSALIDLHSFPPEHRIRSQLPLCSCCSLHTIPWSGIVPPHRYSRDSGDDWSPDEEHAFLVSLGEDWLAGAIQEDDGTPDFALARSLVFFVKHPVSRKLRLCVDMRPLNAFISGGYLRYGNPKSLLTNPEIVCAFKFDLRSAFKSVRICRKDARFFAFRVAGHTFRYCSLCFGVCCAPCSFCSAVAPVIRLLAETFPSASFVAFMDDLIVGATSTSQALMIAIFAVKLFASQGWWLSAPKCFYWPASRLRTLGFIFDAEAGSLHLSPAKARTAAGWLRVSLNSHVTDVVRLSALERALGLISFFSTVCPHLKLFRVSLIAAVHGKLLLHHPQVVEEASALADLLESPVFVSLLHCSRRDADAVLPIALVCDASDSVAGGVLLLPGARFHAVAVPLSEGLLGASSGAREVAAIHLSLRRAVDLGIIVPPSPSCPAVLRVYSDSKVAERSVAKRSSKSRVLSREILALLRYAASINIMLQVTWCRRDSGLQPIADWASRLMPPLPRLSAASRDSLVLRFGPFDVDLCALSPDSSLARRWFSPGSPCAPPPVPSDVSLLSLDGPPGWLGTSSAIDWDQLDRLACFAFPPPALLNYFCSSILSLASRSVSRGPDVIVALLPPADVGRQGPMEVLLAFAEVHSAVTVFQGTSYLIAADGTRLPPLAFRVAVIRLRQRPSRIDNDSVSHSQPGPIPIASQPAHRKPTAPRSSLVIRETAPAPTAANQCATANPGSTTVNPASHHPVMPRPTTVSRMSRCRPPPRRLPTPAVTQFARFSLPVCMATSWDDVSLGTLRAAVRALAAAPPDQALCSYDLMDGTERSSLSSIARSVAAHTGQGSWESALREAAVFGSFLRIEVCAPNDTMLSHWTMGALVSEYLVGRRTGKLRMSPWSQSTTTWAPLSTKATGTCWSTLVCRLKHLFPAIPWKSAKESDWKQVRDLLKSMGQSRAVTTPKVGTYFWELQALCDMTPISMRTATWDSHFACCLFLCAFMLRPCYGIHMPRSAIATLDTTVSYCWSGLTKTDHDLFFGPNVSNDIHAACSSQPLLVRFLSSFFKDLGPSAASDDPAFPSVSYGSLTRFLRAELQRIGVPDFQRRTPGGFRVGARTELARIIRNKPNAANLRAVIDRIGWWKEHESVGRKTYEKDDEDIARAILSELGSFKLRDTVRGQVRIVDSIDTTVVLPSQSATCSTRKRPAPPLISGQ